MADLMSQRGARRRVADEPTLLELLLRPQAPSPSGGIPAPYVTNQPSTIETIMQAVGNYGPIPAQLATELTGVPSLVRGGSRMGEAMAEGDGMGFAAGAGQAAMGALPAMALTRAGAPIAEAAFSSMPRAAGTGLLLTAPETAEAANKERKKAKKVTEQQREVVSNPDDGFAAMREAVKGDPDLESLFSSWRESEVKATANVPNVRPESADKIRADARAVADRSKRELLDKIEAKKRANAPFRDRFPGVAQAIGGAAAGVAAALPFANTVKTRLSRSLIEGPAINRLASGLDEAFETGADPAKIASMQKQLSNRVGAYDDYSGAKDFGKNAALSSLLAFEGASIPEQTDVLSFAPGHPVRQLAQDELTRPGYYADRVPAAALTGLLTAGLGTKAGAVLTPGGEPRNMAAARELIDRGSPQSIENIGSVSKYLEASGAAKRDLLDGPTARHPQALPAPPADQIQRLPAPSDMQAQAIPGPVATSGSTHLKSGTTLERAPLSPPASKPKGRARRSLLDAEDGAQGPGRVASGDSVVRKPRATQAQRNQLVDDIAADYQRGGENIAQILSASGLPKKAVAKIAQGAQRVLGTSMSRDEKASLLRGLVADGWKLAAVGAVGAGAGFDLMGDY